ncbi:DUF4157 domain-containing protein [Streptomyces sp. NPDC006446]|uniref:eCIS core domain-containing protein n=1 Tax=Streptomyces sp. NPDC006446 TaxID=3154301 RepID=UPI0033BA2C91
MNNGSGRNGHATNGSTPGRVLLDPLRDEARQLDAGARADLERSLGASFGDVIVHTGAASAAATDRVDAAAFTVGRHIVFSPGAYDPTSLRGRMLLAHELAHLIQQRRGGDLEAAETLPESALTRTAGGPGEQSAQLTAAQAALGGAAPVAGAAPVGIARQDKQEERGWRARLWAKAKEAVRDKAMETLGTIEGVVMEAGQIVDTVVWVESTVVDAIDESIDYYGRKAGLAEGTLATIKSFNASDFKAVREEARKLGMVDKDTGAPIVSGKITEAFTAAEDALNKHVFTGVKADDSFFSAREIGQLEGVIGSQVLLATIGVGEVQLALKVVSGLGVIRAIVEAIERNPDGFASDRLFWTAVANALLHIAGLKAASSGKKIVTIVVDVVGFALSSGTEIAQLRKDYLRPSGKERDEAIRKDIQALIKAVASAVQQAITHHKSLRAAGANKNTPEGTASAPTKSGAGGPAAGPMTPVSEADGPSAGPAAAAATKVQEVADAIQTTAPPSTTSTTAHAGKTPPPGEPELTGPVAKPTDAPPSAKALDQAGVHQDVAKAVGQDTQKSAAGDGPSETPASISATPVPQPAVKPKSLSKATEAAAAGKRIEQVAAARKNLAEQSVTEAHTALDNARKRLEGAKEAAGSEPPPAAGSKKNLSKPERERRAAQREVESAEKRLVRTQSEAAIAAERLTAAKAEAARRASALQAAVDVAAAKKAAAEAKKSASKATVAEPGKEASANADAAVLKALRAQARELRKQAVKDPAAVDRLRNVYEGQPDAALNDMKSDPLAAAELARRRAKNPELAEIMASEARPQHEATVRLEDGAGKTLSSQKIASGGVTAEDVKQLGWRKASQASHTEAKAVSSHQLKPGQTMRIDGQYDPCASCRTRMQAAATSSGATIVYWWPGGPPGGVRFTPGKTP